MFNKTSHLTVFVTLILFLFQSSTALSQVPSVGSASELLSKYTDYRNNKLLSGEPQSITVNLGYVKGLSRSFTGAAGTLTLNLFSGQYTVSLNGLRQQTSYSLWLIDQSELASVSDYSNASLHKLADFQSAGTTYIISGRLNAKILSGFSIDRIVLANGSFAADGVIASGSIGLMDKLTFGNIDPVTGETRAALPFSFLVPPVLNINTTTTTSDPVLSLSTTSSLSTDTQVLAASQGTPLEVLIAQGEDLFFKHTFDGNGRTCGTCHPATNNFTIDLNFINSLPPNDPLFVAEFNPALAQLERPALMRQFGLILENVDGLDDPTNKFVMRSVPHTLGLQTSLITDTNQVNPPADMTGWSGDGAPGAGSLRDFAVGAVTQHFTKSLARVVGQDFTLPNNHQLDAMEAFQRSLGRSTDFDLTKVTFLDPNVASGQNIFVNGTGDPNAGGRCSACHGNAGALAANGRNRNFNTNVEDVIHPARAVENFPHDGGFGQTANLDGTFGNRTFNTPPVVEAADTAPFFHNNVVNTLEELVAFYAGPEFNTPRGPGGRFSFTPTQATNLANFMRAINTVQNIDVARRELMEILALPGNATPQVQSRLTLAFTDSSDAIRVLNEGAIFPGAITNLTSAQQLIVQAQQTTNQNTRTTLINQAIVELDTARNTVVIITP